MTVAETARALLLRHDGAQRATELRQHLDQLRTLRVERRRTSQRIGWADRLWVFADSPNEELEDRYERAIEEAEVAHRDALAAWCGAMESAGTRYPPLEIVFRIAHATHDARAEQGVGCDLAANEAMAERLEAIADRVLAIWAPGVSVAQVAGWLADDRARREAAAVDVGPLREDAALGWAVMDARELSFRVARALEASDSFRQTTATLARERWEVAAILEQLRVAREQVSWADKVVPGRSPEEQMVAQLEQQKLEESLQAAWALELHHLELARGFAVHPLMWLHLALLGAASCLRSPQPGEEQVLGGDGELRVTRARAGRAVFFACMVEVRRAADRAFPGVFDMVWPLPGRASTIVDAHRGPYRQRASVTALPEANAGRSPEQDFFATLEQARLRDVVGRAVTCATMIGLLNRGRSGAADSVALTDRLAFWSNSTAEADRDALELRVSRLGDKLRSEIAAARSCVEQLAGYHPALGLGTALVRARATTDALRTESGESGTPRHCPVFNQTEAQGALRDALDVMDRYYGVLGNRSTWARDVMQRLATGAADSAEEPTADGRLSYQGIVARLATQLRATPFTQLITRVAELQQQDQHAQHVAQETKKAVPWVDVLNIFDTTDAEKLRDQWKSYSKEVRRELDACRHNLDQLWNAALESYPPMALQERLARSFEAVSAVSARSERRTRTHTTRNSKGRVTSRRTETYHVCVIRGVAEARGAVEAATRYAGERFAAFPTPTQMLENWVQQEL